MDVVKEIEELKRRVDMLSNTVSQAGKNQTAVTGKVDDTSNRVDAITPFTSSKPAFYGEKEVTFYDTPMGIVSVFIDNYKKDYSVSRIENRLIITLEEAIEVPQTLVTITIQ